MSKLIEPVGLEQPRSSNVVWRYQSLDKFYHLLIERKLHFTQASEFTDKNEFSLILKQSKIVRRKDFLPPSSDNDDFAIHIANANRIKKLKETTYVSTWSLGAHENYALWKIYLGGARSGVAIRTTVRRLKESITAPCTISAAKVRYTNHLEGNNTSDDIVICSKSQSYSYENEYRLYTAYNNEEEEQNTFLRQLGPPPGLSIDVDLSILIDKVYLSPFGGSWFKSVFLKTINTLAPDLTELDVRSSAVRDV
jgi:hypothetical protein